MDAVLLEHAVGAGPAPPDAAGARAADGSIGEALATMPLMPTVRLELWLEVALVLMVAVVPPLLTALADFLVAEPLPAFPFGEDSESGYGSLTDSAFLLAASLPQIALILWLSLQQRLRWCAFGLQDPARLTDLLWAPLLVVLLLIANVLVNVTWDVLAGAPEHSGGASAADITPLSFALYVVTLAVAAFAEELALRGYLLTRLEQLWGSTRRAVLWSSACFASYHVYQGLDGLLATFACGVVYGLAFVKLRRVWPLALAHWVYNLNVCYGPLTAY